MLELERCKGCPHGFARLVGHRGDIESPLVVVGESPGKTEVRLGAPFMGPSGEILMHALSQHPELPNPLLCNAFQCYPGNQTKTQEKITEATHVCQERLRKLIARYPRRVILALGNPAVWSTTNQFGSKITQVRGRLYQSPYSEFGVVAAVHPAYLLRGGGSARQFMADVDYAQRICLEGSKAIKRYIIPEVRVVQTPADIGVLTERIIGSSYCAVDTETGGYQGFDHLRDRILCIGFCIDPETVYVVPEELVPGVDQIFQRCSRTRFIFHNGKFDQKFLWAAGVTEARVDEDTMLLSYAIDETKGLHDLEQISSDVLGAPDWKYMIAEYTKGKHKTYADVPPSILYDYMAKDISGTLQIFPFLRNLVRADPKLELLYTETLIPQSLYKARIEYKGLAPDLDRVARNQQVKQKEAYELEAEFQRYAAAYGQLNINPRSPQQVSTFLYESLALRDRRRPNSKPVSTDEDTLRSLPEHPAVKCLLRYRKVQKGLSTYVNSVEENVGRDGRIHTTFKIHGTTTGRPAAADPNLLNIPRDPDLRSQYRAPLGRILLEVDINQAELRVLADLSKDKVLYDIYTTPNHPSIHDVTRIDFFGDPSTYTTEKWEEEKERYGKPEEGEKWVIHEQKMRAKTVNFGIVYGRGAASLAEEFDIPVPEAATWIEKWFRKYEGAGKFINACRMAPLRGQNLVTPFGFKKRFQIVSPEKLNDLQNQAANFPEQSIAWHCTLHTGMLIQDIALHEYDAYIVNTVYDSILFELPDDRDASLELGCRVLNILSEVPKRVGLTTIPFRGDIKIGSSWGHLSEVDIPDDIHRTTRERWLLGVPERMYDKYQKFLPV